MSTPHILQQYLVCFFSSIAVSVLLLGLGGSETLSYVLNLSLSCSATAVFLSVV